MACDEYLELMSAGLDGELTPEEQRKLETHLAECPSCRALYEELTGISGTFDGWEEEPPADLADNVLTRIFDDKVLPMNQPKKKKKQPWGALAAAAAVVICLGVAYNLRGMGGSASTAAASSTADTFMVQSDGAAASGAANDAENAAGVPAPAAAPEESPLLSSKSAGGAGDVFSAASIGSVCGIVQVSGVTEEVAQYGTAASLSDGTAAYYLPKADYQRLVAEWTDRGVSMTEITSDAVSADADTGLVVTD